MPHYRLTLSHKNIIMSNYRRLSFFTEAKAIHITLIISEALPLPEPEWVGEAFDSGTFEGSVSESEEDDMD